MIFFLEELVHYGDASPYIYSHSAFLSLTMNSDFTIKPRSFDGSFPCHATRERDTQRDRDTERRQRFHQTLILTKSAGPIENKL